MSANEWMNGWLGARGGQLLVWLLVWLLACCWLAGGQLSASGIFILNGGLPEILMMASPKPIL